MAAKKPTGAALLAALDAAIADAEKASAREALKLATKLARKGAKKRRGAVDTAAFAERQATLEALRAARLEIEGTAAPAA